MMAKANEESSRARNPNDNSTYIYVGLESGLRRWAFDGFSLELAIVVIQRRVY